MNRVLIAAAIACASSLTGSLVTAHPGKRFVELSVIDDTGRRFRTYRAISPAADIVRTYLQAEPDARFRLRVRNPHGERVGVVIAVDGRNIISGQRSALAADEAMYIVDAYREQEFSGWRTDANHVQAFYFTAADDSYAAAWGDHSAMGTIAVAVFREQTAVQEHASREAAPRNRAPQPQAGNGAAMRGERYSRSLDESQAGTGFGERRWSRSRRVHFVASAQSVFRHIVKYEWRDALCRRGVIASCGGDNRFWPDLGYAPYPPGYLEPRW